MSNYPAGALAYTDYENDITCWACGETRSVPMTDELSGSFFHNDDDATCSNCHAEMDDQEEAQLLGVEYDGDMWATSNGTVTYLNSTKQYMAVQGFEDDKNRKYVGMFDSLIEAARGLEK